VDLTPLSVRIPDQAGPEVASIDSSQKLIMDYQLTELLVAVVEG